MFLVHSPLSERTDALPRHLRIHSRMHRSLTPLALLRCGRQGVGVGYFFASAALKANLLKHQASNEALRKALAEIEEAGVGPANGGEGGVNGMEAFHDKYASTRGDH